MKPLNRRERFLYNRLPFLVTGLIAVYISFNTPSVIDRLLLITTGSIVVSIIIKDTVEDKEP